MLVKTLRRKNVNGLFSHDQNTRNNFRVLWVVEELLVILFLAVVPILLAYPLGGQELFDDVVKSMIAPRLVIFYMFFGLFVFGLVAFLNWFYLSRFSLLEKIHDLISRVFYEVATCFVGLLRFTAGMLLSIPVMWLLNDFSAEGLPRMRYIFFYGFVAFIECLILSRWLESFKRRYMRNS